MKKRKKKLPPPPPTRGAVRLGRIAVFLALAGVLTAHAPTPQFPTLTVISGDGQTGTPGQPFDQKLKVQLKEFGVPVAGAPVTFHGLFKVPDLENGVISTSAGGGNYGDGGPATQAPLARVEAIAALSGATCMTCSPDGGVLVSDTGHYRIRKIDPSGVISTVAGNGLTGPIQDGETALQTPIGPGALACDDEHNILFADLPSHRIRRIHAATQIVTTVAGDGGSELTGDGGPAVEASLGIPTGLARDADGNLWVAVGYRDGTAQYGALRRVDAVTGIITTPVSGLATYVGGVAVRPSGEILFCHPSTFRVLQFDPVTTTVSTFAGTGVNGFSGDGGPAALATFQEPVGIAVSTSDEAFIADRRTNYRVRKVDALGIITTVAGNGTQSFSGDGGPAVAAGLPMPIALSLSADLGLLIGTQGDGRIRRVDASGVISTFAGNGTASFAGDGDPASLSNLSSPRDQAYDSQGNLYVADTSNGRLRRIAPSGVITTVLGNGTQPIANGLPAADVSPTSIEKTAVDPQDRVLLIVNRRFIYRFDPVAGIVELRLEAVPIAFERTRQLLDLAVAPNGDLYFIIFDRDINGLRLERLEPAASAPVTATTMINVHSQSMTIDRAGLVFILQYVNSGIFQYNPGTGVVSTLPAPQGFAIEMDPYGHFYVALANERRVVWVNRAVAGAVTNVAGNGTMGFSGDGGPALAAQLAYGTGIAVMENGDFSISDTFNDRIRAVAFPEETVTEFTVFTDADGFAFSPKALAAGVFGPQSFNATASVNGINVGAGFSMSVGPSQGTPQPPDPDHVDRPLSNDPSRLHPRWWQPTSAFFVDAPPLPPPPTPTGSHQRIVVDSKNVVHIVDTIATPSGPSRVVYVNDRWETRRSNGFSQPYDITGLFVTGDGYLSPTAPAMAVDPDDDCLHVAWHEEQIGGGVWKQRIVFRRLSQDPTSPGWQPRQVVHEVSFSGEGDTPVKLHHPHIAVGADGIARVVFVEATTTSVTSPSGQIVTTETRRVFFWPGDGPPVAIATAVLTRTYTPGITEVTTYQPANLFMPRENAIVRRDGLGQIHVAWDEYLASDSGTDSSAGISITGYVAPDEVVRRIAYNGPSGIAEAFYTAAGQELLFDFDAGSDAVPQFAFETIAADQVQYNPEQATLFYQYGVSGLPKAIASGAGAAFAAYKPWFSLPVIDVDSRDRPHMVWMNYVDPPDAAGYSGQGVAYGRGPAGGAGPWQFLEPLENRHQGTFDFQTLLAGAHFAIAVGAGDLLHIVSGGAGFYTRAFEPNLGAQDAALTVPVGPGASANVSTGNLYQALPVFSTGGVGFAANVSLVYNSQESPRALMSPGWMHNYHITLTDHVLFGVGPPTDTATVQFGDGHYVVFRRPHGAARPGEPVPPYVADAEFGNFSKLECLVGPIPEADGSGGTPVIRDTAPDYWRLTTKSGTEYVFDPNGRLVRIFDSQQTANKTVFQYSPISGSDYTDQTCGSQEQVLFKITDSAMRDTFFFYTPSGTPGLSDANLNRLCRIQDPSNVVYEILYDEASRVKELKMPLGVRWSFGHFDADDPVAFERRGLLSNIVTPRITAATPPEDLPDAGWLLQYFPDHRFAQVTQPKVEHANDSQPLTTFETAATITVNYDNAASSAVVTNTTFHHTTITFEPRRCIPLQVEEPIVVSNQFPIGYDFYGAPGTADGHRNLAFVTDRRGYSTSYGYFPAGPAGFEHVRDNLAFVVRPGGATTQYLDYVSFNLPEAVVDPEGHMTTMDYDGAGNLAARHAPSSKTFVSTGYAPNPDDEFDTIGNVITYDSSPFEQWTYDPRGRVETYTAPAGGVTVYTYAQGASDYDTGLVTSILRPARVADPNKPADDVFDKFAYDKRGFTKTSKPAGLGTTTFLRDALGRVTHTTEPSGDTLNPTTVTTYDLDSNVQTVQAPKGAVTQYVYDLLGRRVETRDLAFSPARVSKSSYDRRGNLRRAGDFKDQFAYTVYSALNWTTDTVARDGARASFTQDPNGNLLSSTEVGVSPHPSRTTTHQYDERNNRVKITHADPALHDEFVYNLDDLAIASGSFHGGALVTGSATTFNARHLAEATMQIPAGGSLSTPVGSTLPNHLTTSYFYDLNANLRAVRDQLSHVTETTVDAADRPTGSRDARGNLVSSNTYSNLDAVKTASVPNPLTGGADMTVTRTNVYNPRGELKTAVDALNQSVTYTRDPDGLVTNVKDQEGTPSDYDRNPRGWVVEEKVHVNKGGLTVVSTKFAHDPNGNVVKITDPNGHDYLLAYDSRDRLVKLTSPSGCHEDWLFNEFGEVETYTDGCGKVTTFTRNDLGLVLNEKHTGSGGTLADIDVGYQDGFIATSWTDSVSGTSVAQSLDALKRVTQVDTLIGGSPFKHVNYAYNEVGWLDSVTDPEGVAINHRRDANGQLRKVSRGSIFCQMSYDVGNRLQYKDYQNGVSEHRTYTSRGQVETIQTGLPNAVPLVDVAYNYTPAGNPKKIHRNDLKVDIDYEHLPGLYALSKETVKPKPGSPTSPLTLSYGYDGAGNRTTLNRNGVVTTNAYDADNKLTSQSTPGGVVGEQQIPGAPTADSGAPVAAINDGDYANEWTTTGQGQHYAGVDFGSNQNVEKLVCTLPNTKYKRVKAQWFDGAWHDTANTSVTGAKPSGGAPSWYMTQSTVVTFKFNSVYATAVRLLMDAAGGPPGSTTTLRVNELDPFQTLYSPPTTIQYTSDCCGNQLTRKTYTGAALTSDEAFGYDYAHRLASYVRAGSTGAIESSFVYGFTPLGDRLFKTNTQTNVAEFYAHSMGNVIADYSQVGGGPITHTMSYFAADGLDTQIARLVDGTAEYYHGDRLGTVCAKTNALSTMTSKYFDDAWGNQLFSIETLADRYAYTQREKDDESGLMNYRARSYDPRLGRFIQRDPIVRNFVSEHFLYARNSPNRFTDPLGMDVPPSWEQQYVQIAGRLDASRRKRDAHQYRVLYRQLNSVANAMVARDGDVADRYMVAFLTIPFDIPDAPTMTPSERSAMMSVGEGALAATQSRVSTLETYQTVAEVGRDLGVVAGLALTGGSIAAAYAGAGGAAYAGTSAALAGSIELTTQALYFAGGTLAIEGGGELAVAAGADPEDVGTATNLLNLGLVTVMAIRGGAKLSEPTVNAADDLPTLSFKKSHTPRLAENIEHAQNAGHPNVVTHGGNKVANRAAALEDVPKAPGLSRDEYPFASTLEGGSGSWVGHVPKTEQNQQGAILKNFLKKNKIKPGDRYRVEVVE